MMNEKYVLLVEDNPDDVTLAQLGFRKAEIPNRLVVVWDGVEAMEFLFSRGRYAGRDANDRPAVILLDLKLPLVNGVQVLKAIRGDANTRDIPVVVLTSSLEANDQSESYRLGVSSYLQKPTGLARFVEVIQQIKSDWLK